MKYRKIPIISPGLIFAQNAVLLGLFAGELIFGGASYWKEFCLSKWVRLDNKNTTKNSLNQLKTASINRHGFILGGGGAYYRKDFCV